MAETKVPAFQVKHIDGVMHLTLPKPEAAPTPEKLRVQLPVTEPQEA
ncbi:MAG: hypothetical protein JWM80_3724 [Cyanobacteria bacterium RYN_339]|nr:hypothetical protein [Cyanobacteria bacterium RYN_339]